MRSLVVVHPEPSESDSILVELVEDSPIVNIGVFGLRALSSFTLTFNIVLPQHSSAVDC